MRSLKMKRKVLFALVPLLCALSADACSVIVVGKKVSSTGRVIVGHNEDNSRPAWMAHSIVPARDWSAGSVIPAEPGRCATVPQAAHTFSMYWAEVRFGYGDGSSDSFFNENGVLVTSDSGGRSRESDADAKALLQGGVGYIIRRSVGERAVNARDGVRIIAELVEKYGYCHSARIYTVADKDEAWLVQIVRGRNFCAMRCPDDEVTFLPNCYSIRRIDTQAPGDVICSRDLLENARRKGFWDGKAPFDFAAAYQGVLKGTNEWAGLSDSNVGRYRQAIIALTGKDWPKGKPFPFSVKSAKPKVGIEDIKKVLTGHDSPHGDGIRHSPKNFSICRSWTVESMICEFAGDPADTKMHVSVGPGCENVYRVFRPFRGEIPPDMDRPDPAGRLATHVFPLQKK